jgi:acyl-CoA hydrolase
MPVPAGVIRNLQMASVVALVLMTAQGGRSVGLAVAVRHARANAVAASIDRLDFHYPVFVGDFLTAHASLNFVGRTSMEIGVRVETENLMTGNIHHTSTAYLTFVALDKSGRPVPLPPLILDTDEEQRQNREAKTRREMRLKERKKEKANHVTSDSTDDSEIRA